MTSFDAIATQTVRTADHLEPRFMHKADIDADGCVTRTELTLVRGPTPKNEPLQPKP